MFLPSLFALLAAASPANATPAIAPVARAPSPAGADAMAPLAWFVGDWQCVGQFADGRPIRSRERFETTLDGNWLRMRHDDAAPGRYHAEAWWGREPSAQRYAVTVFDNGGGLRHYASAGWRGDALVLENTASAGYVDRFSYRRLDAASYRVDYAWRDRGGAWRLGDSLRCTKAAPHR